MKDLTDKQEYLLEYIRTYYLKHGMAPTYKEMSEHTGCLSNAQIRQMLVALQKKGLVRCIPFAQRSYVPIGVAVKERDISVMDFLRDMQDMAEAIASLDNMLNNMKHKMFRLNAEQKEIANEG